MGEAHLITYNYFLEIEQISFPVFTFIRLKSGLIIVELGSPAEICHEVACGEATCGDQGPRNPPS